MIPGLQNVTDGNSICLTERAVVLIVVKTLAQNKNCHKKRGKENLNSHKCHMTVKYSCYYSMLCYLCYLCSAKHSSFFTNKNLLLLPSKVHYNGPVHSQPKHSTDCQYPEPSSNQCLMRREDVTESLNGCMFWIVLN